MLDTPRLSLVKCFAAIVVSLALACLPFAHRANSATSDPALTAFVQAGGTLADICGGAIDHSSALTTCEACRIVAATLLPEPVGDIVAISAPQPAPLVMQTTQYLFPDTVGSPPPARGPPVA